MINLRLADTFNQELPADQHLENNRRQVHKACFSYVTPRIPTNAKLLHVSREMMVDLGLTDKEVRSKDFVSLFSGAKVMTDSRPFAMCYGGHQFGTWAGQLGDGRAINLFEILHKDRRWALQLKGAGATPFSRRADGFAVLRSSIREHLCSEAMHHLGVPTTRSLSLMMTGDQVLRDMMYDGNARYEPGAVICRVAPSFIRFGNFQIHAARNEMRTLQALADYTMRHFFPQFSNGSKDGYLRFFREVADLTLEMIIHWQRVGFVHGVMNTDNMSILGLTIDYGPFGWLEGYDPNWTPNTTDSATRRYRFGHQPSVALWNLAQLANAIYPLILEEAPLKEVLDRFRTRFINEYLAMMRSKLGLISSRREDRNLIKDLESALTKVETDMTIFFRELSEIEKENHYSKRNFLAKLNLAIYKPETLSNDTFDTWTSWFERYQERLKKESLTNEERKIRMNKVNPKYVLRNYMAQLAIDKAHKGDYQLIEELYQLLKKPYEDQPDLVKWYAKRPDWARNKVGCSMLSCSS